MKFLLFLIPHFWIHEGGHFLVALFYGRVLKFYYSEGSLLGIPVPRYCWDIPQGLTTAQEDAILRAGFRCEFLASLLLLWCLPLAGLYLAGAVIHFVLYRSYGGNPRELEIFC